MSKKPEATSGIWGMFLSISSGLGAQPAYLLVFGLAALFMCFGIATATDGILTHQFFVICVAFVGFLASISAGVFVITRIEPRGTSTPRERGKSPTVHSLVTIGSQGELYHNAFESCREKQNGKATFYHFSGAMIQDEIGGLLRRGYNIKLFVQQPAKALALGSRFQSQRIEGAEQDILRHFGKPNVRGRLTIYESACILTVRAAVFDDDLIVLGWYLFEDIDQHPREDRRDDKTEVRNAQDYGILLRRGGDEFIAAREFLKDYGSMLKATCQKEIVLPRELKTADTI